MSKNRVNPSEIGSTVNRQPQQLDQACRRGWDCPDMDAAAVDGHGFINVGEFASLIEKPEARKRNAKLLLKWVAISLIVVLVPTITAMAGLMTYVVSDDAPSTRITDESPDPVIPPGRTVVRHNFLSAADTQTHFRHHPSSRVRRYTSYKAAHFLLSAGRKRRAILRCYLAAFAAFRLPQPSAKFYRVPVTYPHRAT